jgi:hypothetical protein
MSAVETRRKAKEEYLLSLQKQKTSDEKSNEVVPSNSVQSGSIGNRREQLLEEKRKAFFEGKGNCSDSNSKVEVLNSAQGERIEVNARNSDIASRTKLENKTVFMQQEPKLSDWRNLGFPSEYSYAKHLGILNDPPKPIPPTVDITKESKILNITSNQSFHTHNQVCYFYCLIRPFWLS